MASGNEEFEMPNADADGGAAGTALVSGTFVRCPMLRLHLSLTDSKSKHSRACACLDQSDDCITLHGCWNYITMYLAACFKCGLKDCK